MQFTGLGGFGVPGLRKELAKFKKSSRSQTSKRKTPEPPSLRDPCPDCGLGFRVTDTGGMKNQNRFLKLSDSVLDTKLCGNV